MTSHEMWNTYCNPRLLLWTLAILGAPGRDLRLLAVQFVRETPIGRGQFVADLLTDQSSHAALDVAERFAIGNATSEELETAQDAAWLALMSRTVMTLDACSFAKKAAFCSALQDAAEAAFSCSKHSLELIKYGEPYSAQRELILNRASEAQARMVRRAFPWSKVEALIEAKANELSDGGHSE